MTMSPARRLSSTLQGGFLLRILQSNPPNTNIVSGSVEQLPHTTAKGIILNQKTWYVSTDSFASETSRLATSLSQIIFQPSILRFETHPLVTRLVKAEIVSPYHGILINTGLGNPTVPSITAPEE